MEKETLLTGLRKVIGEPDAAGNYGETGITQRTLDAYVDGLMPSITDDAAVDEGFYTRHGSFLKTMGGQLRHEYAEFVKGHTQQKPPKAEAVKPEEKRKEEAKAQDSDVVDKLLKESAELKRRLDERESAEKRRALTDSVREALKDKGNDDEAILRYVFKGYSPDAQKSVETLVAEATAEYDAEKSRQKSDGGYPRAGHGAAGATGKELDGFFAGKFGKK